MTMIIFHHFSYYGGADINFGGITLPVLWCNLIIMGGKVGVNIFVLISGYFLIEDDSTFLNWKRIAKFWGEVFFYSTAISVIFMLYGSGDFSTKEIIRALFPITFSRWGFASTYFVLYLLHPFINKSLRALDKKTFQALLTCFFICWCVIPTFTTKSFEGNSLLWFIFMYSIASYIKMYGLNNRFECKHYFLMWFVFSLLTYLSSIIFSLFGTRINVFLSHATYFYGQGKITTLLISVSLFMALATLNIPHKKWVNIISSTTFGVYLIHDESAVRSLLWGEIFRVSNSNTGIIIYSIAAVVVVFTFCSIVDVIRQRTAEILFMRLVNKYIDNIVYQIQSMCDRIKILIFGVTSQEKSESR